MLLSCGLAAILLFWAALADGHSHGFYTFLRVYICGLSLFLAYAFHIVNRPAWALAALCTAILFNPVFTIDLERDDWHTVNLMAGAIFAWVALQPYARATGRKWAPYAPGAAALILVLVSVKPTSSYGSDEAMAIENLAIENLVVNDTTMIESTANMSRSSDANMSDMTNLDMATAEDTELDRAAAAVENATNGVAQASSGTSVWDRMSSSAAPQPSGTVDVRSASGDSTAEEDSAGVEVEADTEGDADTGEGAERTD